MSYAYSDGNLSFTADTHDEFITLIRTLRPEILPPGVRPITVSGTVAKLYAAGFRVLTDRSDDGYSHLHLYPNSRAVWMPATASYFSDLPESATADYNQELFSDLVPVLTVKEM